MEKGRRGSHHTSTPRSLWCDTLPEFWARAGDEPCADSFMLVYTRMLVYFRTVRKHIRNLPEVSVKGRKDVFYKDSFNGQDDKY